MSELKPDETLVKNSQGVTGSFQPFEPGLFPKAMLLVANIGYMGAAKHKMNNWRGRHDATPEQIQESFNDMMKHHDTHYLKYQVTGDVKELHQAAWRLLAALEIHYQYKNTIPIHIVDPQDKKKTHIEEYPIGISQWTEPDWGDE